MSKVYLYRMGVVWGWTGGPWRGEANGEAIVYTANPVHLWRHAHWVRGLDLWDPGSVQVSALECAHIPWERSVDEQVVLGGCMASNGVISSKFWAVPGVTEVIRVGFAVSRSLFLSIIADPLVVRESIITRPRAPCFLTETKCSIHILSCVNHPDTPDCRTRLHKLGIVI